MIWPFKAAQARLDAEADEIRQDIARVHMIRSRMVRQWPTVESLRRNLVERRMENGFGEELEVAWTPRKGRATGDVNRAAG